MVVQESRVLLLDRDAEILQLNQLGSRSEVDQFRIVVREGEPVVPRVLKRVVTDQVVHYVVPLDTDCLLDESALLEWIRVDQ